MLTIRAEDAKNRDWSTRRHPPKRRHLPAPCGRLGHAMGIEKRTIQQTAKRRGLAGRGE
ncbi:MAG: hypothetical protein ACLUVV_01370 [Christensenellales bacterium]